MMTSFSFGSDDIITHFDGFASMKIGGERAFEFFNRL